MVYDKRSSKEATSRLQCIESLNDILHAGPKLQNDLVIVLTQWRLHKVGFCANIKMMFRQIEISPKSGAQFQTTLLNILLSRPSPTELLAPHISPYACWSNCIDEAADTVEAAWIRWDQIVKLLKAGGCILKKWVTYDSNLREDIPPKDRLRPTFLQMSAEGPANELGVTWDTHQDWFKFSLFKRTEEILTKWKAVTKLARIFDPVGWLSPLTLTAKLIIKDLCCAHLDWDEQLLKPFNRQWLFFKQEMSQVHQLTIPR